MSPSAAGEVVVYEAALFRQHSTLSAAQRLSSSSSPLLSSSDWRCVHLQICPVMGGGLTLPQPKKPLLEMYEQLPVQDSVSVACVHSLASAAGLLRSAWGVVERAGSMHAAAHGHHIQAKH